MTTKGTLLGCYRGLDLTDEKGLLCGKILADMGADITKIEPPGGDLCRRKGPFFHHLPNEEKSLYWFAYNTNKRGITLNLETSDGREMFKRLVARVNFVVESYAPGHLDSLGLGYSVLSKINPGLVLTSITPFGQEGPYKDFAASDMVVCALGGLMSDCGEPEREPVQVAYPQSYMAAGAEAAAATMLAMYHQGSTGQGQHVDVCAMECMTWAISEKLPYWSIYQYNRKRAGNRLRFMMLGAKEDITLPLVWPCKDGYIAFAFLGGLPGARNNEKLVALMEKKGMAPEHLKQMDWPNFDLLATDPEEVKEKYTKPITQFFRSCTKNELYDEAVKASLSLYPLNDASEIVQNEQLAFRNFWVDLHHPELGESLTYPGAFALFSETPVRIHRRAPKIGEHNGEVYEEELGLSREDLILLKQAGVV